MALDSSVANQTMSVDKVLTTTRAVRKRLDLTRPVERELITECLSLAQQAPSGSDSQCFHFVVVTDAGQRAALADLFRGGYEVYKTLPAGVYGLTHEDPKREAARLRIIDSLEHLVEHIHEVPVHVVPCVEGWSDGLPRAYVALLTGSVIPATWSFMLAARARGLATCWTMLHMLPGDGQEADRVLGLPPGVVQLALIPTAYALGHDFKPAYRRPLNEIVHHDRW
jgi:nitroreductase